MVKYRKTAWLKDYRVLGMHEKRITATFAKK